MNADNFQNQRVLWLFPFLNFTGSRSIITGWAFRAEPSSQTVASTTPENVPLFQLWEERTATPGTLDYRCIRNCIRTSEIESVEANFMGSSSVYKQTLGPPLVISPNDNYILGILLPPSDENHLNLAFQNDEMQSADRLSYFFRSRATFVTIRDETYKDNLHVPLVTPLFGELVICSVTWFTVFCLFFSKDEANTELPTTPNRPTEQTSSLPSTSAGLSACVSQEAWLEA